MNDSFDLNDLDIDSHSIPQMDGDTAQPIDGGRLAYLDDLNKPQTDAVLATEGPVLVLAGAGTGKTRVLTTRLGHLVATGRAAPWNILAVTFTNKAANEMRGRVETVINQTAEGMWLGTFHSICVRILRRHAELVGLSSNFTILDSDDTVRLLKQLIQAEGIDEKRWPARQLAGLIDRWKNKAMSPAHIPEDEAYSYADGKGKKLYALYQARLKILNACDFGDLLMHVIAIFQNKNNKDILQKYQNQFKYILVDEYQDTNVAQYLWLRLLSQATQNICCVGDDDQSIYGWRGAEVGNILRFSDDYKGALVIRLEQNYRSTGHILAAASALITKNTNRLGKTLWTSSGDGEKVNVQGVWDAPEEARTIGDEIERKQRENHPLSEMAILVRAGFQMREFEERLITIGLPYRVIGGPRFYERAEIRDAMAYLRVIAQPDDDLAFERIINVPKRGIGKTTVQKLHEHARALGVSMTYAAQHMVDNDMLPAKARTTVSRLLHDFQRWRQFEAESGQHIELTEMVLDESGYTEMWQNHKAPDAPGRLDNLKEMVNGMAEFENLAGFLEHIALVMNNDQNDTDEKITLMTLHAAKGLEFDTVFLPGWEEGIFPSQRTLDETGINGLEEERRLAYVGMTRARKKSHIYFAGNRQIYGQWQSSLPSRFIEDLPEEHIDVEAAQGLYSTRPQHGWGHASENSDDQVYDAMSTDNTRVGYGPGWQRSQQNNHYAQHSAETTYQAYGPKKRYSAIEGRHKKSSQAHDDTAKTVSQFAVGERVFHEKFGYGTVKDMDGNKLLVSFEKAGSKRIVDRFIKPA